MTIPSVGNYAVNGGNNHSSEDISLSISSNSGRVLLVFPHFFDVGSTSTTVSSVVFDPGGSDESSFTYETNDTIDSGSNRQRTELWYLVLDDGVSSGSYTIRVTYSESTSRNAIIGMEVNDADTTDPIGATVHAQGYSDTLTDTVTTTESNSLVVGCGQWHDEVTFTATDGTEICEGASVNLLSSWAAYANAATTGDYTISGLSSDTPDSDNWNIIVAEILEAAAGDVIISPADAASMVLAATNPTVVLGSVTVTPGAASIVLAATNPTVVLVSITVTPGAASIVLAATDPTVVLGSVTVIPGAASMVLAATDPTVVLGSITITPADAASIVLTATDPSVLAGVNQIEMRFRVQDSDNYWQVTIDSSGNLDLDEVSSGSPVQRGTSAGVITAGERVVIVCTNERIKVFDNINRRIDYQSAAAFKTETAGELETEGSGGAVSEVISWPRVLSGAALSELDKYV